MDADLQHEPESVPDVARPVLEGAVERPSELRCQAGRSSPSARGTWRAVAWASTGPCCGGS